MTPINQADSAQAPDLENKKRVGDILREARVARDEELEQVANLLRIRLEYLRAIEENRPHDLPGTAYALGFVRTYASHLNLETKALVDQFKVEAEEIEKLTELNFPEPLPAKSVPGGALVFMGLLLFGVFYGLWYYLNTQDKSVADLVPDLPPQIADVIDGLTGANSEEAAEETAAQTEAANPAPAATAPEAPETPAPSSQDQATGTAKTETSPAMEPAQPASTETDPAAVEAASTADEPAVETAATEPTQTDVTDIASEPSPASEEITAETSPVSDNQDTVGQTAQAAADTVAETASTPDEPADTVAPADTSPVEAAEETVASTTEDTAAEQPVAEQETVAERPVAALPTSSLPTATVEPKVYGEENDGARVIITAKSTAWVEISSPSGDLLLTRLLNSGDMYKVPNNPGITLITGNAGALEISVDGKPVAPIGEVGAVVRDVSLDPESLTAP